MTFDFWSSFWPALASGLIASTFTGLIVGVFVTILEYRMEERRLHTEYEAEFAICKERLRIALSRPDMIVLEGPVESLPTQADAAITIMREYPLAVWREHLFNQHRQMFLCIAQFLKTYTAFISAAGLLGNALRSLIRKHNAELGLEASVDAGLMRFFTGNAMGLPAEEILPWIPSAVPAELREGFLGLTYDTDLAPLIEPFRKSRKELEAAAAALGKGIENGDDTHPFERESMHR